MKRYTFYLLLIMVLPAVMWSQKEIVVPFSSPGLKGRIKVNVMRGSVTLKGTNQKEVIVNYKIRGEEGLRLVEGKNGMKKIVGGSPNIKISEDDNMILVRSEDPKKAVDFIISVPKKIDAQIGVYNDGNTIIENIEGEITTECHNGPIVATNISGILIANSYNGGIKVEYDKVSPDTPLSYTAYNGDLDITFPPNMKADLKMRTDMGEIFTGFDMDLTEESSKDDGTYLDGWIKGRINGGGPEVLLKNYTGNIYIRKKEN